MKSIHSRKRCLYELLGFIPILIWNGTFFIVPLLTVVWVAFHEANIYGEILAGWTFSTFVAAFQTPNFLAILVRTLIISAICCLISVGLAIPTGYYIATLPRHKRLRVIFLIMNVFWTSFLLRIFCWKILLHPEGFLKSLLVYLRLISPESVLLYSKGAVLLTMIHVSIPFAVLPIYASADRFDFSLMEAASDLGASTIYAFLYIFIPGIKFGILQSLVTVFLQTISSYAFSSLIGGTSCEMIGNKIVRQILLQRNLPIGSAVSLISSFVAIFCTLLFYKFFNNTSRKMDN
ncbi:ABC transporter permease [Candidatus Similichlamydia epinepheli]|uniref:ABC transporter permease n=1 Tax=Candidatus Similichlamydia epinepheli TaxID=1903953 RepID=UPI0013009F13|nr:ABC transporter permease [Candidatus Similichlamydia epinepheli]